MSLSEALWSSTLHHCIIESEDPARLVAFYEDALQMDATDLSGGRTSLVGPGRTLVIAPGSNETVPGFAFNTGGHNRLGALKEAIERNGVPTQTTTSELLVGDAFEVVDPHGVRVTFGCAPNTGSEGLPPGERKQLAGRLQHIVYASPDPDTVSAFYQEKLGFMLSDTVLRDEDDANTAIFIRSDPEHHSLACFRAPGFRFDHVALETTGWMDIRDWADHLAEREIQIWWGPGRHGPGNNLFFMIRDPDGNRIEISAECELMPREMAPRVWPHNERTLNLWGASWMRD
jgi:catechol 2,3-dioxygenase